MGDEVQRRCHYCQRPAGRGHHELRPYGPGGASVCFACVKRDPAIEAQVTQEYLRRLDEAAAVTGQAVLTPDGPVAFVVPGPSESN